MSIFSKLFESRASTWLNHTIDRIYDSLVGEHIPRGFRSIVVLMRLTGAWPSIDDSPWYKRLAIAYLIFIGILFPLTLFVNVLYATTIEEIMNRLFYVTIIPVEAFKSCIIYWRCDKIRQLFRIHTSLLADHTENSNRVARENNLVHFTLTATYNLVWCVFAYQSVYLQADNAIFPSTSYWPYAFARSRTVFWLVLIYQALNCLCFSVWVGSMQDSFYISLINANCSQVADLKQRLASLGTIDSVGGSDERDLRFYKGLVDCCKRYELCLRYGHFHT